MPRPLRRCAETLCKELVRTSRCQRHRKERNATAQRDRGTDPFLVSSAWRKLRAVYVKRHPLCQRCLEAGRTEAATEVHHVRKRADYPELALDWNNLEALCKPCHSRETARGL